MGKLLLVGRLKEASGLQLHCYCYGHRISACGSVYRLFRLHLLFALQPLPVHSSQDAACHHHHCSDGQLVVQYTSLLEEYCLEL